MNNFHYIEIYLGVNITAFKVARLALLTTIHINHSFMVYTKKRVTH